MASNSPHCIHIPSFFIHLSVDGHFGGFHILAIIDSTCNKQNNAYVFSILFSFPLSTDPDMELLNHMPRKTRTYALVYTVGSTVSGSNTMETMMFL